MSLPLKVAMLIAATLLLTMTVSLAWSLPQKSDEGKMPVFSVKDRQLIAAYYNERNGKLAPGSIDRSGFPPGVEKALVVGSKVPMMLEKDLRPLPKKLESQLTQAFSGGYGRYTLGRHVVLVRTEDLAIADIIRNVTVK